jgi:SPP1 family phage portal protein
MFIHEDEELTHKQLTDYIADHQGTIERYNELWRQYTSRPPILDLEEKEAYKPDNRLVANFAKYIVDTFNGYFTGIPVKVSHEKETVNESINHFWRHNDMDDTLSELSKITSIYGVSFLYIWQDEESKTRATYNTPFDMFVIRDNTVERNVKYGVRYHYDKDNKLIGTLYTDKEVIHFNDTGWGDSEAHYYPIVPIIEFVENDEQQSLIRPVETLINAYNKALSEKANDVDYFADAYLAILGAELDEEGTYKIRDNRIINLYGTDDASKIVVKFLDKPDGDTSQENLLNRIVDLIYQLSMVANINDESFGNSSGVALEYKLQPMKNLSGMKERKFTKGLNQLFKCFTALPTNVPASESDAWIDIEYRFIRNIPRNIQDEAETARNLEGVVSKRTQLTTLSIVDDVDLELERIEEDIALPEYDMEVTPQDDNLPRDEEQET